MPEKGPESDISIYKKSLLLRHDFAYLISALTPPLMYVHMYDCHNEAYLNEDIFHRGNLLCQLNCDNGEGGGRSFPIFQ